MSKPKPIKNVTVTDKFVFTMHSGEKYAAMSILGRGSSGVVFKCISPKNLGLVALKRVPMYWVQYSSDAGAYHETVEFNEEKEVMRKIGDHPYIVPLSNVLFSDNNQYGFLEMPYFGSRHMQSVLQSCRISSIRVAPDRAKLYLWQMLSALAYAHSKGVWHRDVKPLNMILSDDASQIRLIDWGLSVSVRQTGAYSPGVQTLYYRAPEVLMGVTQYTGSVDSWGVGCTMFMLLNSSDELLFSEGTELHLLSQIADETKEDSKTRGVRRAKAKISDPLALDLLDRLLCFDHTKRMTATAALKHPYFTSPPPKPLVAAAAAAATTAGTDVKTIVVSPPPPPPPLVLPPPAQPGVGKVSSAAIAALKSIKKDQYLQIPGYPPPRSP